MYELITQGHRGSYFHGQGPILHPLFEDNRNQDIPEVQSTVVFVSELKKLLETGS